MKSFLGAMLLTVISTAALAGEFEIIGSVYQNQNGEKIFVEKTKQDIQMCIDICIQTYEKPGAELKACVTKCAN